MKRRTHIGCYRLVAFNGQAKLIGHRVSAELTEFSLTQVPHLQVCQNFRSCCKMLQCLVCSRMHSSFYFAFHIAIINFTERWQRQLQTRWTAIVRQHINCQEGSSLFPVGGKLSSGFVITSKPVYTRFLDIAITTNTNTAQVSIQ